MKTIIHAIRLFRYDETFQPCIIIQYPSDGKIVRMFTYDLDAILLVQADVDAQPITAHFHVIKPDSIIYADTFEYIGTFEFVNTAGHPKLIFPVARIADGHIGMFSKDFIQDALNSTIPENESIIEPKEETNNIPAHEQLLDKKDVPVDIYGLFGINNPKENKTENKKPKRKYVRKNKTGSDKTSENNN